MKKYINPSIASLFCLYFMIVTFNLFSILFSGYTNKKGEDMFFRFPFFKQSWNMFSPPPESNTKIFYRIHAYNDGLQETGSWFDITEALYEKKRSHWFIGATSSDLSYLLFNSIVDVETDLGNCYSADSLTVDHVKKCNQQLYPGDVIITNYIRKLLINKAHYAHIDSVKIEYKLIEDYFPPFKDRALDYHDLKNHKITEINRPIIKIL